MLLMGLLFLAVFIATAVVFFIVRQLIFKMVAGFIFVLSVILMFVVFEDDIKSRTVPIALGEGVTQIYIEHEPHLINNDEISRIYVGKPGDKVKIEIVTTTQGSHVVEISEFAYEWALKNELNRVFKSRLDVAQF